MFTVCEPLTANRGVTADTFFPSIQMGVTACQIHLTNTLIINDDLPQAAPLARSTVGQPVPGESQLSPTSSRRYENSLCVYLCLHFLTFLNNTPFAFDACVSVKAET